MLLTALAVFGLVSHHALNTASRDGKKRSRSFYCRRLFPNEMFSRKIRMRFLFSNKLKPFSINLAFFSDITFN